MGARERKGGKERKGKDGKGVWVPGSGWKWVGRRNRWRSASLAARTAADGKWVRRTARTAADGVGATEWLEMGGETKPLVMSELGCVDGCGRVAGNGWGEEAAGDQRAWLRGRLRTANGWGELRGRLHTAWVPGSCWKWVGRRSRCEISELGCADGCGQEMGAENCADGCGRRGCNGVAGNGWGEEAAGDERAWLRGRLRTGNGCGELRGRLGTQGATEWLEMGGERR